jgi:16S rRNA (adenine1518-N6/adenine1519-N6)-dimethyltransferase
MRAKKRYGQHFLQPAWADKLVAAIDPRADEWFVEIGPGPGALTLRLAPKVAGVTAIELDADLVSLLRPQVPPNVTLVQADFLDVDLASVGPRRAFRVAGNLPYNVSSPILFALIAAYRRGIAMVDATLMLQREVAARIAARPGTREYGVLSIFVQLHADVRPVLSLPPGAFRPVPQVHSSVVNLRFRAPSVSIPDEVAFEAMVRSMFTQRRKTLVNALRPYSVTRARDVRAALTSASIDPARRPETLQLTELARLADFFATDSGRAVL